MQTFYARLPVHHVYSLCFSSAVTLRAMWLHVDLWYCAMWNLRPHIEVLYYSWSARGEHGREETERWITVFWNWYGNLVNVLIRRLTFVSVTVQKQSCDIQGFTGSHQHCWSCFGKFCCRFAFVWAFRNNGKGEWLLWSINRNINICAYCFFIGIVKKLKHMRYEGAHRHCGVLCFTANAVWKCICWSLFVQR